jgi:hypothetical protein
MATTPHLDWARLFRVEMAWRRRVLTEVATREAVPSTSREKMRSMIRKAVLASFLPSAWRHDRPACVFVSFGSNPLVALTRAHCPLPVLSPEAKARNILRGDSLSELDALYYLLHFKDVYPPWLRKCFIGCLMRWLTRQLPGLQRQVFITHQDYFDKSAVLHAVSSQVPLQILGVQHGLLRHAYLRTTDIFPGVRSRHHAVYSALYAALLHSRDPMAQCHVLGPPFELGGHKPAAAAPSPAQASAQRPMLLFISSGDLQSYDRRQAIEALHRLCQAQGVDFFIRPHPQERHLMATTPLPFAVDSKEAVFSRDPRQQVFAGFFSTFLFEAALRGFKTAWVSAPGATDAWSDLPEVQGLPNASVHTPEDLDATWLRGLFDGQSKATEMAPLGLRVTKVLAAAFPRSVPEILTS